jgi:hypothetical protein
MKYEASRKHVNRKRIYPPHTVPGANHGQEILSLDAGVIRPLSLLLSSDPSGSGRDEQDLAFEKAERRSKNCATKFAEAGVIVLLRRASIS